MKKELPLIKYLPVDFFCRIPFSTFVLEVPLYSDIFNFDRKSWFRISKLLSEFLKSWHNKTLDKTVGTYMAIRKKTPFKIQIRTGNTMYVPIIDELGQLYMIDWINECIRIFLSIFFPQNTERNNFFLEKLARGICESFYSIL